MRRVPRREVVDHWLACEGADPDPNLSDAAALDRLLCVAPGVADVLWRDGAADWFRVELPVPRVARLRVVETPPDMLWDALSIDGTVGGAAARIDRGDPGELTDATGVDVGRVVDLADAATVPALVCYRRRPWRAPFVADGNHRATAAVLRYRRTGDVPAVGAYVGVARPRPRTDAAVALGAVAHAVRSRFGGVAEPNGF